jgi:nitrilase
MQNKLFIATIQMVSSSNWQQNLATAAKLVKEAANKGAKLAVLPEFFIRIADNQDTEFYNLIEPLGNGVVQESLSQMARENNIHLVGGTIPIQATTKNKCYNTCIVYSNTGDMICHYHKIHLFKFDNGEHKFDEEIRFTRGNQAQTFQIGEFNFGLTICYDLRFPELFRKMAGVDAIILPAAFVHHTGQAHWEVLLRARAIENQCYIIASGQGGMHDNGRHTFGHSMIINPWGTIESNLDNGEGIVYGTIDKETINRIRTQLPALNHRQL